MSSVIFKFTREQGCSRYLVGWIFQPFLISGICLDTESGIPYIRPDIQLLACCSVVMLDTLNKTWCVPSSYFSELKLTQVETVALKLYISFQDEAVLNSSLGDIQHFSCTATSHQHPPHPLCVCSLLIDNQQKKSLKIP